MCDQLHPLLVHRLQKTLRELADRFDNPPAGGEGCLVIRDLTRLAQHLLREVQEHTEPEQAEAHRGSAVLRELVALRQQVRDLKRQLRRGPGGAGSLAVLPKNQGPRPALKAALEL
jgi:hypothetical protein